MKLRLQQLVLIFSLSISLSGFSQDGFVGEIKMFAGNFEPKGWAFCDGRLLPIAQNQALFSILGTTYGGDGKTNFALPDLRGRVAMGLGQGQGLTSRDLGQMIGSESVTLTVENLPSHSHTINGSSQAGTTADPTGAVPANTNTFDKEYALIPNTTMNSSMVGNTGGNAPVDNIQPSTVINYIIALQGIFPSRN